MSYKRESVSENTIRLIALRPYMNKYIKKVSLSEDLLPITAKSIQGLFDNYEAMLESVGSDQRYNLFYTVAISNSEDQMKMDRSGVEREKRNDRVLWKQEVIPFDLDHCVMEQAEEYLDIFSKTIGVPLDNTIVVYTGNGIQILVKANKEIYNDEYFKTHNEDYKLICAKLDTAFKEANLHTDVDSSVFSPARLMRMPGTYNMKPMDKFYKWEEVKANAKPATLHPLYRKLGPKGIELLENSVQTKMQIAKVKKESAGLEFHRPDVKTIREECIFVKECLDGTLDVHEPECYAFLGVAAFLQDDDATALEGLAKFSSPTIDSMDKGAKLIQAKNTTTGPRTCKDIAGRCPDQCNKCKHKGVINTPLSIQGPQYFLELVTQLPDVPNEMQIVNTLCMQFNINFDPVTATIKESPDSILVKDPESSDIFQWGGSHWTPTFGETEAMIKRKIDFMYKFKANKGKTESTWEHFKGYIPCVPESRKIYEQNPFLTNFSNCTVKAVSTTEGNFELISYPHRKTDFLTYALPLRYEENGRCENIHFNKLLTDLFAEEDEGIAENKIKALQLMFGACLMPLYPHLFMLKGVAGGGKSTICKILASLLKQENISAVEPKDFLGFDMESMAGKLVNMVTDLDISTPIQDAAVKRVEDRTPQRIKRKNRTDLYAPIPAVHIFGCNSLPKMQDGGSGAHERRWTIVEFTRTFTKDGNYNRYFAETVFSYDPQGIMNFAVAGLKSLLENKGRFLNPGKAALSEWQSDSDIVLQFLEALEDKEIPNVRIITEAFMSYQELYEHFRDYCELSGVNMKYVPTLRGFVKKIGNKLKRHTRGHAKGFINVGLFATKNKGEF